jgi:hypothetical protein
MRLNRKITWVSGSSCDITVDLVQVKEFVYSSQFTEYTKCTAHISQYREQSTVGSQCCLAFSRQH